ncbi:MAG: prevent-host-death protein [Firmicutes bacterium HGW-Firmicutes-1]|jgi:prevent-host-death family protein|nr:MAG: prevent-host-death protein [Firmicutes bacterium HGW-Firmicutes-1]
MIVHSTDLKTNLGKYLNLVATEDIVILKSGKPVAKMIPCDDWSRAYVLREGTPDYNYDGQYMSYDAFMKMNEKSEARYEYIDGQVYYLASPNFTHQRILGNLYIVMYTFFKGKPCQPFLSPFDVTLKRSVSLFNVVQPDLLVVCDQDNRNEKDYYLGTPALVVEIISPETSKKDLIKKLDLYMSTGVEEYWVINPEEKLVIIYTFLYKEITSLRTFNPGMMASSVKFPDLNFEINQLFD